LTHRRAVLVWGTVVNASQDLGDRAANKSACP
jgi:hypothetical protein